MNPLISLKIDQNAFSLKGLRLNLESRTGLPVRCDAHHIDGKRVFLSNGKTLLNTEEPVTKFSMYFADFDYNLKFHLSQGELVLILKNPIKIGYFEGCLIVALIDIGATINGVRVDLPEYIKFPYEQAQSHEGFNF